MTGYIPYQGALDPLGAALGAGLGNGLAQLFETRRLMSDQEKLIQYLRDQQNAQQFQPVAQASQDWLANTSGDMGMPELQSPAPQVGAPQVLPPRLQTPEMQKVLLQLELGKMLDPMQQAQIANTQAQTRLYQEQAYRERNPLMKPPDISLPEKLDREARDLGYEPGTPKYDRYTKGVEQQLWIKREGNRVVDRKYIPKGETPSGDGWTAENPSAMKLDLSIQNAMTPSTQSQIEQDLVNLDKTRSTIGDVMARYDPAFLTVPGKMSSWLTAVQERAGGLLGMPSEDRKKFLSNKTGFESLAMQQFNAYRKFITGVAGGVKEMEWIQESTLDPKHDSPTQFEAKYRAVEDAALKTRALLAKMKQEGISLTPENIQSRVQQEVVPFVKPLTTEVNTGATGTDIVRIKDAQEYQALPSGTIYIDPTGTSRRKP